MADYWQCPDCDATRNLSHSVYCHQCGFSACGLPRRSPASVSHFLAHAYLEDVISHVEIEPGGREVTVIDSARIASVSLR